LGGKPDGRVLIAWLVVDGHDAEAEVKVLPERPKLRALAILERLSKFTLIQFGKCLKPTYVGKILERKNEMPEGGLRLLFVYGRSHVWCIGAFIKGNTKDGNRKLKSYLEISKVAEML
jgi:hypothetical protein